MEETGTLIIKLAINIPAATNQRFRCSREVVIHRHYGITKAAAEQEVKDFSRINQHLVKAQTALRADWQEQAHPLDVRFDHDAVRTKLA